jgi:D-alanyl-D-alanine carboxypeptidase/D-alanyl-D-alanine-endopeptidase (penicillin-binding protein 4)
MTFRIFLLVFLLTGTAKAQLSSFAEEWKKDKGLKNAAIGFYVMEAANSKPVAELNAHQLLVPASSLKIISTSAALGILGADYRYETRLYYRGNYDKNTGILNGDLIIVGSGDPTLQSENFYTNTSRVTDKWASVLKEKGLKEIKGNIIGDASYFDRTVPANWIWEDISNYFGAVPCGLSYYDNKFKVFYNTAMAGSEAVLVNYAPAYLSHSIEIVSTVKAEGNQDRAYAYGDPFSFSRQISGTLPTNKTNYEIELALPDPALLCAEHLYQSLKQAGIDCKNASATSNYSASSEFKKQDLMYTHYSPTLDKIIYYTNVKSNNLYCESLVKTLGKGNSESGLNVIKKYWQQRGLETTELYMEDGSGLARINAVTPYFQAHVLSKLYRDSVNFSVFNKSLPISGKQGSMSNIGKNSLIENNMRAKTGYLTRTRAYCGYVTTKSGKDLAFSLLFNNYNCTASQAKWAMEKFLIALGEL